MKTHNENYDLEFLDNVKEEVKVILELQIQFLPSANIK
jgi:hypothetical protein